MGQTSRVVTSIDGIEVIELTREDPEGHPLGASYYVQGEKYTTLKEAWKTAKTISEERNNLSP
ncbi:MAG: hypothetical protein ABSC55_14305 [Syntrophorhabdales bacterium]